MKHEACSSFELNKTQIKRGVVWCEENEFVRPFTSFFPYNSFTSHLHHTLTLRDRGKKGIRLYVCFNIMCGLIVMEGTEARIKPHINKTHDGKGKSELKRNRASL